MVKAGNVNLFQLTNHKSITGVWKNVVSIWKEFAKINIEAEGKLLSDVGCGSITRFWEDRWLCNEPLCKRYPDLYNMAKHKGAKVEDNYKRFGDSLVWD
ncbi:hypothetical protein HanRHA438_Chr10g0454841 [Helianthus annuus]|nr:hypothetical protein HanIR_Chr10g0477261 [Helianthus annuus]KAJ0879727.1 hypothetical protein HanRHA438_Chr10g0454841 [Helianthus annuus]